MSFILDALRKSETARRRSEAPDLFATMPAAATPSRSQPAWPMWAVGIVGTLSLLAALWLFVQRAPSSPAPTPTVASATTVETEPSSPAQTPVAVPSPAAPMPEPVRDVAAAAPSVPATPIPAPPPPRASAPERIGDLPMPPEPANAPAVIPPAPPIAPPAGDRPIALADLDAAMRRQLPPLKLSMHLWNETASQRFVILDGQRLKEGDLLGEIVVERIDRDGAVLAWRGSRLKIDLP
jgi:general secretion pathway protein B